VIRDDEDEAVSICFFSVLGDLAGDALLPVYISKLVIG
jgi:hypothetical protein